MSDRIQVPQERADPEKEYTKRTERMRSMSRVFLVFAILSVLGVVVGVILLLLGGLFAAPVAIASILPALAFYTIHLVLDFLVDLGDRVEFMERMQIQQHRILKDLYERSNRK